MTVPTVLFVCTGNICRSPMAEYLARSYAGEAARFASAGTFGLDGHAPSPRAVAALRDLGIDLRPHQARSVEAALADNPAVVYCMTRRHVSDVARIASAGVRIELLDPGGNDIDDPYGGSPEDYERSRDEIAAALRARLTAGTLVA